MMGIARPYVCLHQYMETLRENNPQCSTLCYNFLAGNNCRGYCIFLFLVKFIKN